MPIYSPDIPFGSERYLRAWCTNHHPAGASLPGPSFIEGACFEGAANGARRWRSCHPLVHARSAGTRFQTVAMVVTANDPFPKGMDATDRVQPIAPCFRTCLPGLSKQQCLISVPLPPGSRHLIFLFGSRVTLSTGPSRRGGY